MSDSRPTSLTRRRLQPEERRMEILQTAKEVFLAKGYKNCSMADLVYASGLSAGGFYHYYKDKSELMYDLIQMGSKDRFERTLSYRDRHPELSKIDLLVELTLEKLLDDNEWKKLYVMFLQEAKDDASLQGLFDQILAKSREEFDAFCKENDFEDLGKLNTDFFLAWIHIFYLGTETLNLRALFLKNKQMLRKMILALFEEQEIYKND